MLDWVPQRAAHSPHVHIQRQLRDPGHERDLTAKLAKASKADQPSVYAGASLWYDAVAALGEKIEAAPQDRALQEQRSALPRAVGLPAGIAACPGRAS